MNIFRILRGEQKKEHHCKNHTVPIGDRSLRNMHKVFEHAKTGCEQTTVNENDNHFVYVYVYAISDSKQRLCVNHMRNFLYYCLLFFPNGANILPTI